MTGLAAYEGRVYSQNGEDGVIGEIFHRIGAGPMFAVEFGVGDGRQCLTRYLREVKGWEVLQWDNRNGSPLVRQEHVTAENVNNLFSKYQVPAGLSLLCIDIDGNDFWVWKALGRSWQPRLVVIEYNASVPPDQAKSVAYEPDLVWDGTTYFGASLLALHWLAESKGYHLVHCDGAGVNAFFIRSDLTGADLPAVSPAEAYRPPAYGDRGHRPSARPMVDIGPDLEAVR